MDEREILYKVLFDMKGDLNDLKQLVMSLMKNGGLQGGEAEAELVQRVFQDDLTPAEAQRVVAALPQFAGPAATGPAAPMEDVEHQPADEVVLSLQDSEKELIRRALEKHRNKRKHAAEELGISERTLYRKIKERSEMSRATHYWGMVVAALLAGGCGVYSPYGAQTSGASTFSVQDFEPSHPLVSTTAAQSLAEALRDRIQRQSTLRLVEDGELEFSARVVGWEVRPVNVQGDEIPRGQPRDRQFGLDLRQRTRPRIEHRADLQPLCGFAERPRRVFARRCAGGRTWGVALPRHVQRHLGQLVNRFS